MVSPPIAFGVSQVHDAFPGTISVKPATLLAVVTDAIESLYQQGFRRFLLVTIPWAELLKKVFAIDVLACPVCSGPDEDHRVHRQRDRGTADPGAPRSSDDRAAAGEGVAPGERGLRPNSGLRTS